MKSAITLLLLLAANLCYGVINFAFEEVGSDVVLTVSGSADLTGPEIFFITSGFSLSGAVRASDPLLIRSGEGDLGVDLYLTLITGPLAIGTGTSIMAADSFSGPPVAFDYSSSTENFSLVLPFDYTSGSQLATSTATWEDSTLNDLGITPGTYNYTWNTATGTDSIIVTAVVPEPSTSAALAGIAALGFVVMRCRAKQ